MVIDAEHFCLGLRQFLDTESRKAPTRRDRGEPTWRAAPHRPFDSAIARCDAADASSAIPGIPLSY